MAKRKRKKQHIRLACSQCDTMEGDGLTMEEATDEGWTDIHEVRSQFTLFEQRACMIWWTHEGLCPTCSQIPGWRG